MSDNDPILAALSRIEAGQSQLDSRLSKLELGQARMEAEQERLRTQMNNKMDDILDKMSALRQDVDTVRAHFVYVLGENLTLSQRITKLEEDMRKWSH